MTVYDFGDAALVDFPRSRSEPTRRRPALVVLDIADADLLLAPITTWERAGRGDVKIQDWQEGGLLRESCVRLAKIACLEKRNITRRLDRLSNLGRTMLGLASRSLFEHFPQKVQEISSVPFTEPSQWQGDDAGRSNP